MFSEEMRYDYPLNKDSTVFDIGGYHGEFANRIYDKFKCTVFLYEPIAEFFKIAQERSKGKLIYLFNCGLGCKDESMPFFKARDASGFIAPGNTKENVMIKDIKNVITETTKNIDLMKINIEGMEYELLNRIINTGLISKIKYLQVQFHPLFSDAEWRIIDIQEKLKATHKQSWEYKFIWESWERK